jgi:hypothetical protein
MRLETPLNTARRFAQDNVATLSADVLAWRKSGLVSEGRLFHELATLCVPVTDEGNEYLEAERLVIHFALIQAGHVEALHNALSKYAARGLSVTLTETEMEEIDGLVSQRKQTPTINLANVQGRVGALISKIEGALANGGQTV